MSGTPDDEFPTESALRDPARLAAVRAAELAVGQGSELLDGVAHVAARMLDAPVALVTLVDDRGQRFAGRASARGPLGALRETVLAYSICQQVVARQAPVVATDANADPCLRDHPAVRELGVRAYAGVPITTRSGATLGALCAIDDAPHDWRLDDVARLRELAALVLAELERRGAAGPEPGTPAPTVRVSDVMGRAAPVRSADAVAPVLAERSTDEAGWLDDAARGAAVALWSWEFAGDRVHHTARCSELLGYPGGTLPTTRSAVEVLLHPEDRARHEAALRAHLDGQAPFDVEVRLRHGDGGWRWIALCGELVRDAAGRPLRVAGSAADVTEQRATEAALRERQAHLALLFGQATVGLSEIAADGRFLRVNAELCRIVGRSLETIATLTVPDVTHPDDVVRSLSAVGSVLAHGGSVRLEKRYLRPDGTTVVAESVITRLEPMPGAEPTLLAVTTDLTAWRAAEAALRESEMRFRQLAENVSEMFWLLDLGPTLEESQVIYMNPAYVRITGRSLDEIHAAPALGLDQIDPDDRPRVIEAAHAVMHGTSGVVEYRLRVLGEAERIVRTRMFPVRERDDRVTRIAGLTEDVTEQRALEARLRQAQKMEAVGQLAGGIAHDFNNLLTVISANLEFARGDLPAALPADDPVREDLAEIGRAAERARDLVRQLLAFSRKQPVRLQPVRLAALVRDAEALLRRTLGEEIVLDVRVLDDPTVRADAGQLQQVLLNLAVNGRDAMLTARHGHAGTGGTLTITVDLAPAPLPTSTPAAALASGPAEPAGVRPWARVRVRDTGHGMDAATQAHLFEPFFTTKEVGAGTGLGLASSHGIVTQAGGVIQVASAPGSGTTFTLLLPQHDVASPHAPDGGAVPGAPPSGGRGTVLLVEDEPAVRASVRRVLERTGYVVREAAHGVAALDVWAVHQDEIVGVVTDVRMPVLGGRAMADRLHAHAPELPVVFLSGYSDEGPAVVRGAHEAFVPKPFAPDALLATLGRLLRRP